MDRHNVKVSIQPWDSDKDPNGYWEWMRSISSLVRSCDGGNELQNFTDEKLGLPVVKSHVVPTCIANDPDFDSDDDGDIQRSSASKFRSPGIETTVLIVGTTADELKSAFLLVHIVGTAADELKMHGASPLPWG